MSRPAPALEVLRCLPLDVVEDQVWKLLDSDSAKNFRLTCTSAKQLSEVLITSANFELKVDDEDKDDEDEDEEDEDSEESYDAYV